jgi:hypothetical protein
MKIGQRLSSVSFKSENFRQIKELVRTGLSVKRLSANQCLSTRIKAFVSLQSADVKEFSYFACDGWCELGFRKYLLKVMLLELLLMPLLTKYMSTIHGIKRTHGKLLFVHCALWKHSKEL